MLTESQINEYSDTMSGVGLLKTGEFLACPLKMGASSSSCICSFGIQDNGCHVHTLF